MIVELLDLVRVLLLDRLALDLLRSGDQARLRCPFVQSENDSLEQLHWFKSCLLSARVDLGGEGLDYLLILER